MRKDKHIGRLHIPKAISEFCENNLLRLTVEQTAFDAVNGYALGIDTTVTIKAFAESCPICGYHSLWNPKQKKLLAENRHRLVRSYEPVFFWDESSDKQSLIKSFNQFKKAWEEK